jgi:hypothetical protein
MPPPHREPTAPPSPTHAHQTFLLSCFLSRVRSVAPFRCRCTQPLLRPVGQPAQSHAHGRPGWDPE